MSAPDRELAWERMAWLLGPSWPLLAVLLFYWRFNGLPHFFVHTLMGWNVGLVILLIATYVGRRWTWWDGLIPFTLAVFAMTPDFIYTAGPYHRDWMDLFLFHVALDEILPVGVALLGALWALLLVGYVRFRGNSNA